MRVAVDARPAAFSDKTGIGYYTWHLLRELPRADPQTRYVAWYLRGRDLLPGGRPAPELDLPSGGGPAERWTPFPSRLFERLSQRFDVPRLEWLVRFDVLFGPNFVPPPTRKPVVVTVHDLAFKRYPDTAPHGTRRWLRQLEAALRRATCVIAVSQSTKRDLIELLAVPEQRVTVIPHGVDMDVFRPAPAQVIGEARARLGIDGPYLLALGGIEPRKNLSGLLSAYARLAADIRPALVIAGGGVEWNPEGRVLLREALEALEPSVRRHVVTTGYVTEGDKVALLTGAEALVYPSLYEGFGLPVLEAMACGTPVVTSNVSALPEVAGGAAVLVDPSDPESIAEGISRVLTDGSVRDRLQKVGPARAARFTWSETARRTAEVLHAAAAHGG